MKNIEFIHQERKTYWIVAVLFMVIKLCLHFFTNTNYELHRDEMLYFNMGDYLDWGYASVPPFIGFLAFVVKTIFGYSVFGIRFFPALLGAASIFIMAKIIRELGGSMFALVLASTAFLFSPGFLLIDSLFTPNVIEQFLWLFITWLIFRLVKENNPKWWIWIGIFIGLAFLNKYSVAFFIAGFFIALLLSPYRKLFNSKYFILAVMIGILIILPNIYWQYSHNWPVVNHMDELKNTQMVNRRFIDFFIETFSLNVASIFIWLFGLVALLFLKQEKKHRYLGIASLISMLLFLFSSGKGYYIMGLIPFLLAFGGFAMEKYFIGKLKVLNFAVLTVVLLTSIVALPYSLPVVSFDRLARYSDQTNHLIVFPFSRWEDGKVHPVSQVYADMTGWQELTSYVAKAYNQLPKGEQLKCTIFAEHNYGYAGAIHFYGKEDGLPEAITFSDSYVIWAPDSILEGPIIYIFREIGELKNMYHTIKEVGCVSNPYFREKGLKVFLCTHPKVNIREIYAQLAREAKVVYRK